MKMPELAAEILAASGVDVTEQVDIYALSKAMHADPRCTVLYETCRYHIARAIRRARHPLNELATHGGAGRGQGRKPKPTAA